MPLGGKAVPDPSGSIRLFSPRLSFAARFSPLAYKDCGWGSHCSPHGSSLQGGPEISLGTVGPGGGVPYVQDSQECPWGQEVQGGPMEPGEGPGDPASPGGQWLLVSVKVLDRETGLQAGRSGCRVVQQGLGGGAGRPEGGQEGLGHWRSPSLYLSTHSSGLTKAPWGDLLKPEQDPFIPTEAPTAGGSPVGPVGQGETWAPTPSSQGNRGGLWFLWLLAALKASISQSCPGQLGSPKVGAGSSRGGSWGQGPAHSVTDQPCHLGLSTFSCSSQFDTLLQLRKPEKPVGPKGLTARWRCPTTRAPQRPGRAWLPCSSPARAWRPHIHWKAVIFLYITLYVDLTPVL